MTPKEKIEFAIRAVESRRGDDLERARAAFKGLDLDVLHGCSGRTRRQVLAEYEELERQIPEVVRFLQSLEV